MLHSDNAQEIVCPYKTSMHWVPNDRETPLWVDQHLHNDPVFLNHHHIQDSIFFYFEIRRNNNKASQSWNLFLPATFPLLVIQHFVFHHTDPEKVHVTGHDHVA